MVKLPSERSSRTRPSGRSWKSPSSDIRYLVSFSVAGRIHLDPEAWLQARAGPPAAWVAGTPARDAVAAAPWWAAGAPAAGPRTAPPAATLGAGWPATAAG